MGVAIHALLGLFIHLVSSPIVDEPSDIDEAPGMRHRSVQRQCHILSATKKSKHPTPPQLDSHKSVTGIILAIVILNLNAVAELNIRRNHQAG